MALVVRPDEHVGLVSFPEAIDAVERAFLAWGQQPKLNLPRQIVDGSIRLAVHPASAPFLSTSGLMVHSRQPRVERGIYPAASLLFSQQTGVLDAIVLGRVLCGPPIAGVVDLRTAATSAVATKYLARTDAQTVGVIGSGRQARSHLVALGVVRTLRSVKVYSRSPQNRYQFARDMEAAMGVEVKPVDSAMMAVHEADIVLVMTDTSRPVFLGEWLVPGQHVTSVLGGDTPRDPQGKPLKEPRRDLDDEVLRRSDVVVINSRVQAEQDLQGNIVEPIERGILSWEQMHELGELLAGLVPGRENSRQITLYKNNGGQGIADVALAALVAQRAREQGLGVEV